MNIVIDHHIQKDILRRLMQAKTLRFSELKPDGLESNSFMYHLRQVIQTKYVTQHDDKSYGLTPLGLTYIDSLSLKNDSPRQQPKLIAIFLIQNQRGEYLLAKRLVQPTIDTYMLPSGKQHFGETAKEHAKREVAEQFSIDAEVTYRGMAEILIRHDDVLVSHLVARLYSGSYDGPAPRSTEKFVYEWHAMEEKIPYTPGTKELIEACSADSITSDILLEVRTS